MTRLKLIRTAMLASAFMVAASASAVHANLLTNASFEDPLTADGPPFVGFWESFSGDGNQDSGNDIARNSTLNPLSGAQHLELSITSTSNTFAGVFQDVEGLTAGDNVEFSGWHLDNGQLSGGIEIRIEFRDSVNNVEVSRTPNMVPTLGNTYELFSLPAVVPAGADTARVVYAIQSFGGATDQLIYVDDVSFVPEPATLSLLAVGGFALLRRRA